MASVKRKFAASLIMLFMVSSIAYTGQTTRQAPDGCGGDMELTTNIQNCLIEKGVEFEEVCVTQDNIDVVLTEDNETPVGCNIISPIRQCVLQHARNSGSQYEVTITVAPSIPGAPAQEVYKGHVGAGSDPDLMPDCID
jgi:hypothetical protein